MNESTAFALAISVALVAVAVVMAGVFLLIFSRFSKFQLDILDRFLARHFEEFSMSKMIAQAATVDQDENGSGDAVLDDDAWEKFKADQADLERAEAVVRDAE